MELGRSVLPRLPCSLTDYYIFRELEDALMMKSFYIGNQIQELVEKTFRIKTKRNYTGDLSTSCLIIGNMALKMNREYITEYKAIVIFSGVGRE